MKLPLERDVQKVCVDWLTLWGAFAIRTNSGGMKVDGRYVRFNSEPGCSDLLVVLPGDGRFLAIEVKKPGRDRTSPFRRAQQASFRERVERAGGLALVVTSLRELQDALKAAGYDTEKRHG